MKEDVFLTIIYVIIGLGAIGLFFMIYKLFKASKTSKNKLGDHNMKDCEGYDNGRVWLYFPTYFNKKK